MSDRLEKDKKWSLEDIKQAYGYGYKLPKDTYPHWLISRVEELESINDNLGSRYVEVRTERFRYKQVLEDLLYSDDAEVVRVVTEALKGESE